MAIIVEEGKSNSGNIIRIAGWIGILGILGVAIYYIFFAAPELVIITPPVSLQEVTPLAGVTLHPEDVLNSPSFQALKPPSFPLPTPQGPASVGRQDPFLAP